MLYLKQLSGYIPIAIILIIATILRFYWYDAWSLSNDELSALARLQFDELNQCIRDGVKLNDFHPAGIQVFLWFWTAIFGLEVWIVRLPFVISGILSVYMVYAVSRHWFNINTALLAAATLAILEYPILYSQLARPYSPGLLFILLLVYFWTKIVFAKKPSITNYVGYALSAAAAAYTHNYSFLFVFIIGATGLFFIRRKELIKYLLASLGAAILYVPHIHIFLYQFSIGGVGGEDGWLTAVEASWFFDYIRYVFNDSWIFFTFIFIIGIAGLVINPLKKLSHFQWIAIMWFFHLFIIGYLYSIFRNPILQYSILIFSFPFLLIFLFSFYKARNSRITYLMLGAILLFGIIHISLINKFYKAQHFGEFKELAENISKWTQELGKENINSVIAVNDPFYIHYYLDSLIEGISFDQYNISTREDLVELNRLVTKSTSPFFIYARTIPAKAIIVDIINSKYPCKLRYVNYDDLSEVYLFSKTKSAGCIKTKHAIAKFVYDFEKDKNHFGLEIIADTSLSRPGNRIARFDDAEYGMGFKKEAGEINNANFNSIRAQIEVLTDSNYMNASFVFSIEDTNRNIYYYQTAHFNYFVQPSVWSTIILSGALSEIKSPDDIVRGYIWSRSKHPFYIDDFCIEFYSE